MFFFRQSCQDVTHCHENLTYELASLTAQRTESQQLIRDLEEENKALRETESEGNMELDRQESHAGFNSQSVFISKRNSFFFFFVSQAEGETEEDV